MEQFYWAALNAPNGLGTALLPRIVEYFGSAEAVFKASREALAACGLITPRRRELFLSKRRADYPKRLAEFCNRKGIQVLCLQDKAYPDCLRHIYTPPVVLYIKGSLPDFSKAVGIVGSRKASAYGLKVASTFAEDLAASRLLVVSGGAKGIDTAAHTGALKGGGPTVAVLGCGLDIAYPAENKGLFERITENGAVISEYPPGTQPIAGNFPRRNRIVNGLTKGILLVEAAKKSGAMITVEFALDEGHEVYCVPGNIYLPGSISCHSLIKDGAKLVDRPEDIIEDFYPPMPAKPVREMSLFDEPEAVQSAAGRLILQQLTQGPLTRDQLAEATGLSFSQLSYELLELHLQGIIGQEAGQKYYRI